MVQFSVRNRATIDEPRLPLLPPALVAHLKRLGVWVQGLVIMLFGLALVLALFSYNANDPSINTSVSDNGNAALAIQNWLGGFGALIADLAMQWLGAAASWMVGLGIIVAGFRHIRRKPETPSRMALVLPLFTVLALLTAIGVALMEPAELISSRSLSLGAPWQVVAASIAPFINGLLGGYGLTGLAILMTLIGVVGFVGLLGFRHHHLAYLQPVLGGIGSAGAGIISRFRRPDRDKADAEAHDDADDETGMDIDHDEDMAEEPTATSPRGPRLDLPGKKPAAIEIDANEAPKRQAKARQTAQPSLGLKGSGNSGNNSNSDYEEPSLSLLYAPTAEELADQPTEDALQANAGLLEGVLADFSVKGEIQKVRPGPVVTLYELEPAPGTKSQRVIGIADDIARSMSAISARVAVVPGKNAIGIELPNETRQTVWLHEVLADRSYQGTKCKLPLALGKDIGGAPVIADLARMPHLLVAGTTGSGKSVAVNTMILSLLYKLSPEQCRFIMIDPKMLELSIYGDIPHLLCPVVTEPKKAVVALKWVVREMEDRYRAMSKLSVRNIDGYNQRVTEARKKGEVLTRKVQTGFDPDTGKPVIEEEPIALDELPYIVVIVDEFADLMLVAGKEIEAAIQRLAQMARAAGIHLIMATQRPSVDVITGTIKANFPTRISFAVTSKIDSRTILGEQGAEQLLGMGDMLYMAAGGRINRVHGPFVKDEEVEAIVKHLKMLGPADYIDAVTDDSGFEDSEMLAAAIGEGSGGDDGNSGDELFDRAVDLVARERKASTSFIQRHLQIGYNRAARIIEDMEKQGMVSAANHVGKRDVLLPDRRGEE